ncbi:hypothetical protein F5887DRAFT_938388 [Amanita rubescens]|nr:hypothetical protein F5887DRAFT_938388 [Amanita rubescens]
MSCDRVTRETIMSNDQKVKEQDLSQTHEPSSPANLQATDQGELDRSELLGRARSFLASPQVAHQDASIKRKFLAEKGLRDVEIDAVLREVPSSTPTIPPRTYPPSAPSNLPTLLLGFARIFSWIAGGSAVLVFIYWRFLLPRVTQTLIARQSLRSHYSTLLQKFTLSLSALKESQSESYSVLPHSEPYTEPTAYSNCRSISEVLKLLDQNEPEYTTIPPVTLLRISITNEQNLTPPTTEDVFRYMEDKIPWLVSEDGRVFEQALWETLNTCPLFSRKEDETGKNEMIRWTYNPQNPPEPTQLQKSLDDLSASLPKTRTQGSKYQHAMQALSDLTGYISSQVYLPYRGLSGVGGFSGSSSSLLSPAEEELRREIRALKGLVLNRRSFMATIPRPNPSPQQPITT